MAIDDANKRRSAFNRGMGGFAGRNIMPIPDGDINNAADRLHMAGFYRGIAAAAPPGLGGGLNHGFLLHVYNGGNVASG